MKHKIKKIFKTIAISIAKRNTVFRRIFRSLRQRKNLRKYNKILKKTKIDEKLMLFETFSGRNYSDSPKAIYLEMLNNKKYKDYKFVWIFNKPENYSFLEKNRNTKVVKFGSDAFFRAYAEAKYWIVNSRISDFLIKREGQIFIQCWHGTPLKRLAYDIKVEGANAMNNLQDLRNSYSNDAMNYDYFISPSKFCTEVFTSAFNLKALRKEDTLIETGYPRNDFLYSHKKTDVEKIKKNIGIPKGKKIILYAPTWRDNQHRADIGYTYKLGLNIDKLQKELAKDYIILFRTHLFVANTFDFNKYEGFIYDLSKYDDISDLYIISDLLITDYSSVFFDFANLKRPILFYMYDLEEYKNKLRDFYIDLEELPGPIIEKEDILIKEIKNVENNKEKHSKKYNQFNEKFNYLDDANASKRVIEVIFNE